MKELSANTYRIINWIDRMIKRHGGGVVVDREGRYWDWGQALCIGCYGLPPDNWPDEPTDGDVAAAWQWEERLPAWIRTVKAAPLPQGWPKRAS